MEAKWVGGYKLFHNSFITVVFLYDVRFYNPLRKWGMEHIISKNE